MVYLSKSKYCGLWQCPKIAWLKKYKPEELTLDDSVLSRMEAGNEVGDLAMGLFGDFTEVTAYNGEKLDLSKMIENTKLEIFYASAKSAIQLVQIKLFKDFVIVIDIAVSIRTTEHVTKSTQCYLFKISIL